MSLEPNTPDLPVVVVSIDQMLDHENSFNKTEAWNKINKTLKIQKMHKYAEKFGKEQKYTPEEIEQMKLFFSESLEKKKFQKTKEVIYDKILQEVMEIPGLMFNHSTRKFTIRQDCKRISTLKSLTPKRTTEKLKN